MKNLPPEAWLVAAIVYFICPIDLSIIDIPIIGWIDDVLIAYWCLQKSRAAEQLRTKPATSGVPVPTQQQRQAI